MESIKSLDRVPRCDCELDTNARDNWVLSNSDGRAESFHPLIVVTHPKQTYRIVQYAVGTMVDLELEIPRLNVFT